ncbi:DNA-directed DNA polymerase [Candidatus Pacearchaeota archaeon]|nr:DNA-directed DNA polymerase [Candidatus Pacearchaeota archaeon]
MKTKFIPIEYDYFDWQGRNHIKIIGRDDKGKRLCIIDTCDIYLWAILKNNVKKSKIEKLKKEISKIKLPVKAGNRKTRVEKVELHNKKFLEKPVKALKIFATNYKDLHDIADKLGHKEIEKRRGYDLGFVTHYIIEKKISPMKWYEISGEILNNSEEFGGIDACLDVDQCIKLDSHKELPENKEPKFEPKVLAYDIETDELKIGKGEILMISLVDIKGNFKKVITWKKTSSQKKKNYVEYVKDEAELVETFTKYVREISPDFLVGYFSDGFDLPYLRARAEKLKANLGIGLDDSVPKFSRAGAGISTGKISGIVHIDLLRFIKTAYAQYMKSETLSLNQVATEFLGDQKKEFKIKHSSQLNKQDFEKYFEYNLQDSILVYNLFEKFWQDLKEFSKIIHEPVFDISRAGLSKYVGDYILHNLEKFNEIPEKRPTHDDISKRRTRQKIEGAFVLEPEPGIYEKIAMFDFTSMHTSIIISMNLSGPTLLGKKPSNKEFYETPEIEFKGKKQKFYFSKKQGFIPTLLNELFEKRKQYKSEYKKNPNPITFARSNAFKVLSASIHGYIGFFGARYYSLETSASVLGFVRKFNKDAISKIRNSGHKVIYGDTDSIAFLQENKSESEIKELLKKINSDLPGIMELELEGFFKRGIWVTTRSGTTGAKKKYALIDKKDNLKIRGFETVRRDWCQLSRKLQNKIIEEVLKTGNEKSALTHTKKIIKKIKNREVDLEDLIIKTQLKKPISEYKSISPHVVAAQRMRELEIPISQGNLIEYYIAEKKGKNHLVRERVKLPQEPGEYDIKYYLEHQVLPAVENIFHIFGIEIQEIIDGKKQEALGKWF